MEKVLIPQSTVAISRLGFGCARVFGGSEHRHSASLLDAAIRCGIRHFDTAPAYGSEDVLGAVLAGVSDATIATKIGLSRFNPATAPRRRRMLGPLYRSTLRPLLARAPRLKSKLLQIAANPQRAPVAMQKRRLHRDEVLREIEDSLTRLRRTTIDLYLLHEPDRIEITDELHEVFLNLQKDGLIRSFGLAFGGAPTGLGPFGTVVQCRFPDESPTTHTHDVIRIYHGVVRFGLRGGSDDGGHPTAQALISRALHSDPRSAVIFSASSTHQIKQVSRA